VLETRLPSSPSSLAVSLGKPAGNGPGHPALAMRRSVLRSSQRPFSPVSTGCRLEGTGAPVSVERRDQMLAAVEAIDGFERLRAVVKQLLDEGVHSDVLKADLEQIRGLVSTEYEDKVLDVMDLLVGWCAPQFRLLPPEGRD
jgi:hypothetical protein